jgi:phosphoribosylformimino-5-aminoimidazole carboxamide ribonucleotide (ProFAR) isomerase
MNIDGAITGKAMYEKTLSLKEAIKVGGDQNVL